MLLPKLMDAHSIIAAIAKSNPVFFAIPDLGFSSFRFLCFSSKNAKRKSPAFAELLHLESGSVLLSRAVSSQVPSALKGLTSVFGMGTGGTLSP